MKHRNLKIYWTVVQHSAWVNKGNPKFYYKLEETLVANPRAARMVQKAGGMLFDTVEEATAFIEHEMNTSGQAPGCFSERYALDGTPIYIPRKKVA